MQEDKKYIYIYVLCLDILLLCVCVYDDGLAGGCGDSAGSDRRRIYRLFILFFFSQGFHGPRIMLSVYMTLYLYVYIRPCNSSTLPILGVTGRAIKFMHTLLYIYI